jgi:hypothetical protein
MFEGAISLRWLIRKARIESRFQSHSVCVCERLPVPKDFNLDGGSTDVKSFKPWEKGSPGRIATGRNWICLTEAGPLVFQEHPKRKAY